MLKLLVQLSDPHIKSPASLAYGRVDTGELLRQAVASVNRLPQAPQAVVITGDLTDFGRADEYAHLGMILEPLRCPVYLLPGNHDDRSALRRAFPGHAYLHHSGVGDGGGFVQYTIALGGLRLVCIDTTVPMQSHGELCPERLAALDVMLSSDRYTPTIVAMHHPPFRTFIGHMDDIGLRRGAAEMADIIARHPQVERVICGHLHRSIQVRWGRTLAMTAPSTAHQVCLDLSPEATSLFNMEPPGFLVHAWSDAREVVSHEMQVGRFAGPFPFHEGGELID